MCTHSTVTVLIHHQQRLDEMWIVQTMYFLTRNIMARVLTERILKIIFLKSEADLIKISWRHSVKYITSYLHIKLKETSLEIEVEIIFTHNGLSPHQSDHRINSNCFHGKNIQQIVVTAILNLTRLTRNLILSLSKLPHIPN